MSFLSLLLSVATNPATLRSLAGLLILAGAWFACTALGLRGTTRLLIMVGVVLLVAGVQVLFALAARRKRNRAAVDLETSMIMEADQSVASAEAGDKRAREEARRELVAAIDVLKRSQLGDGRGGKAALYVLPWYLVLGAGYTGKSGVIRNSGLQPPDKGPGELRGIGASSNCEWWFTNHAVLLEADRRFASVTGAKAAERDWEAFLATLHKQRSRIALNGVLLTVSAADLMQGSAGETEAQAKLLRKRLDAVAEELKLVFPVYLLVTKLDLVQGFDDFFAGLGGAGAGQIFGSTLRVAQMRGNDPGRVVAAELALLYQTMCRRRQMRLVQDEHRARRDGTYLFPLQMRALGGNLQRFVQVLCEPNAYGRNPLLRGFYFTAAGGEGQAADLVLHEMARVLGVPAPAAEVRAPGQPLFLRDFFRRVLVPDCDMARPTRGAARRVHLMRRGFQYAALAAVAALVITLGVSFGRNLALVHRTGELAREAADFAPGAERGLQRINDKLPLLDDLRGQLEKLDRTGARRSPALGLGMYRGTRINEAARRVYLDRFHAMVGHPYLVELANWLRRTRPGEGEFDEFFRRYQAYRMLLSPTQADTAVVVPVMRQMMAEEPGETPVRAPDLERLDAHARFALRHAQQLEGLVRARESLDADIAAKAGRYIGDHWQIETYYSKVIERINRERSDLAFSLQSLGSGSGTLIHPDPSDGDVLRQVPAAYTRQGWDEAVSRVLGNTEDLLRDSWLLPEDVKSDLPRRQGQLLQMYADNYKLHWRRFLLSIALEPPSTLGTAARQLHGLQQTDSPYRRLVVEAGRNLSFAVDEKDYGTEVATALNGITRDFGALQASLRSDKDGQKPLERHLGTVKAIEDFLATLNTGDHEQAAAEFTRGIFTARSDRSSKISESLAEADLQCGGVDVPGDPDCNRAFRSYLRLPALAAWQACLRETEQHLDAQWARVVVGPFGALAGRYPLAPGGEDAGLDEFGRYFHGGGTLQTFVKGNLEPYLDLPGYLPRLIHGQGLRLTEAARESLNKGARLRDVLFAGDRATPQVVFKVRPGQSRVTGQEGLFVKSTTFSVGRDKQESVQGLTKYREFRWPPQDGANTASISAVLTPGDVWQQLDGGDSAWALFRLIAKADGAAPANPNFSLTWRIPLANRAGAVVVPYDFAMESSEHAFLRGLFAYTCPSRLFP
ncbi:MAG: type VI secretion system membrane subunit TssM [Candidatus Krumholzibacteriia bacterium]